NRRAARPSQSSTSTQQPSPFRPVSQTWDQLRGYWSSFLERDNESSSDEEPAEEHDEPVSSSSSDDDKEEQENRHPNPSWTRTITEVSEQFFNHQCGPQLHHHHAQTELEIFQCFLTEST